MTKEGDIYSFGIIMSEIINRGKPFDSYAQYTARGMNSFYLFHILLHIISSVLIFHTSQTKKAGRIAKVSKFAKHIFLEGNFTKINFINISIMETT